MKITKDNAFELGKNHNGWFLGHFMDNPNLRTNDLEIQIIDLKKNYEKESIKANPNIRVVTVLIDGQFELSFPEIHKRIRLEKRGDFIKFDLSSKHIGKAIEKTTILTIKWPSIK